jgi:tetratricopeptide (TPR) repeat protein
MVAYEGKEPFVFVSYAHKDKNKVLPIVEGLQSRGFRVWYDKRGISAGSEWAEVIADHLEHCCCMVAFVSRSFGASNNCREELNYAKELKKTILVVYLEDRNNLRGAVRMQLSTLHSLNLNDYAGNDALLQELSEEEALQPCLVKASAPAKPTETTTVVPDRTSRAHEMKMEYLHSALSHLAEKKYGGGAAENVKHAEPTSESIYKQAREFYDRKEYAKAIPILRKAAALGNHEAMTDLGVCYQLAWGVPRNYGEASSMYRKAADCGNARAQYYLALCYEGGVGVGEDKEEARKWYQKSADQGYKAASQALELM